jgi:hypothetical protein
MSATASNTTGGAIDPFISVDPVAVGRLNAADHRGNDLELGPFCIKGCPQRFK